MARDPQIVYLLINLLMILVVGAVGWLIKRAITANDNKIDNAIAKIDQAHTAVGQLQLLIVGDYYPRKEHAEYARSVDGTLEQIRQNIHSLRGDVQALTNRLAVLETLMKKEQHE